MFVAVYSCNNRVYSNFLKRIVHLQNKLKKRFYILLLLFTTLLYSCLAEDDVFDTEFVEDPLATETSIIISLINETFIREKDNNPNPQNCYSFKFPIDFKYNTGQVISIVNEKGLEEAANSQSNNFHINSIFFPITVLINSQEVSITNTSEFNLLFNNCNIVTLKDTLLENIGNCFDFQYPINLNDTLENIIQINSTDDFITFLNNKNTDYVPSFTFPLILLDNTVVTNYFSLYEITNTCNNTCPELTITKNLISNNGKEYLFTALTNDNSSDYLWTILNNDTVMVIDENSNNSEITYEFENSGTYEICTQLLNTNCSSSTVIKCIEVEVPEETIPLLNIIVYNPTSSSDCLDLAYDYTISQDNPNKFILEANQIDNFTDNFYNWSISNSENDDVFIGSGKIFEYEFTEVGDYIICVSMETPECTIGVSYCKNFNARNTTD